MAITWPLALPATPAAPARVRMRALAVVGVSVSPFTFARQTYAHQGQRWQADLELPPMARADAEVWVAFLLSLNGREGTFTMGDPANVAPRGAIGGTPLVKGASQTGTTLLIDGCTAGVTDWLKVGDMIQLGSGASARLHKVLADVDTNGSGEASLDLWPAIRTAPADNAALVVAAPVGVWRLASNEMAWDVGAALQYGITIVAESEV